jgi:hypothetical protein
MADVIVYRTYPFKSSEQDPIIDEVEKALTKDNLIKKPGIVKELSGLSGSTLYNIFVKRKTRCPRYATVAAIFGALGYHATFERNGKFDLDAERSDAKRWNLRREARKLAASSSKRRKPTNGTNKESRPSA